MPSGLSGQTILEATPCASHHCAITAAGQLATTPDPTIIPQPHPDGSLLGVSPCALPLCAPLYLFPGTRTCLRHYLHATLTTTNEEESRTVSITHQSRGKPTLTDRQTHSHKHIQKEREKKKKYEGREREK